jgi:predicted Zn-dependent peptidase
MSDVKAFFQKHYVPSNAVLVVAGKVKLSEVKALAEKWFAPIPAGVKPQRNLPQEPVQTENRTMEIVADVPANRLYKAYPVIGRYEPGYHAIDLMADLLGRGESSYLYEHLVQKQRLFDTIGTYQTSSIDPGLLIIQGQVSDDVSVEAAEQALEKAIQDFASMKITEKDLQMVKNQSEASLVFGEVEVLNRAMNLAMAANAGDANLVNMEAEKIAKVQTQDLEKWAQRLFIQGKSNTLKYKKIAK